MSGFSSASSIVTPTLPFFLLQTPIHLLDGAVDRKFIDITADDDDDCVKHDLVAAPTPKSKPLRRISRLSSLSQRISHIISSSPYPRRTITKPKRAHCFDDVRPKQDESRCLQRILPGLYLAFEHDQLAFDNNKNSDKGVEEMRTREGEQFTHVVSLSKSKSKSDGMGQTVHALSGTTHLQISIPADNDNGVVMAEEEDGDGESPMFFPLIASDDEDAPATKSAPSLDRSQLTVIRDFLVTSHHHHHLVRQVKSSSSLADGPARLLITTPRDRRADAVAAVVCYMAHTARMPPREMLGAYDSDEEVAHVWRDVVGVDGLALIESVDNVDF